MPSNVLNVIHFGQDLNRTDKHTLQSLLDRRGFFSFEAVKPMPECLQDFEPDTAQFNKIQDYFRSIPPSVVQQSPRLAVLDSTVQRAINNHQACGFTCWKDFRILNWGTQWDCYNNPLGGQKIGRGCWVFCSAWIHPTMIIYELSRKLPHTTLTIEFADQDYGSHCASYQIRAGSKTREFTSHNRAFAQSLWERFGHL